MRDCDPPEGLVQGREVSEAVEDQELEEPPEALGVHDVVQEDRALVEHVQEEVPEDRDEIPVGQRVLVAQAEEAAAKEDGGETNVERQGHEDRMQPEEPAQEGPPMKQWRRKPMMTIRGNLQVARLMTQSTV